MRERLAPNQDQEGQPVSKMRLVTGCGCVSGSLTLTKQLSGTSDTDADSCVHDLQAIDRRERLRRLALETIDLSKDPYFMRNHLGQYECRLCLTLHNNEGNYLAHTQVYP